MCFRVFGNADPAQNATPKKRSASIKYWKKALSYFFNTTSKWNEAAKCGNPTQSIVINRLIKAVKRQETRGTGAESKEDREFSAAEFKQVHQFISPSDKYRAMLNYQYQLIARCDDTAHAKKENLKACTTHDGYLITRIAWSKNIEDNSNSPTQIILADMDPDICCYLSLSIWLENWLQCGNGALSQWLFCEGSTTSQSPIDDQDSEADKCK